LIYLLDDLERKTLNWTTSCYKLR